MVALDEHMKRIALYGAALVFVCALRTGHAATVTQQLLVRFGGSLSGRLYVPGAGETVKGTLQLKSGTETLSQGMLRTSGVQEGVRLLPQTGLTAKTARGENVINTSFVMEIVARRNRAAQGFQTLFAVHGSVAYRYKSGNPAETEFMTYGPESTGWRTVSGVGVPVSDSEQVHYALVYDYVSQTQCRLSCYVNGQQVGKTLTNSTAAEGQPTWGIMFAGDSHPSAADRGMPLDTDAIAFSTFTGTFDPGVDFALFKRTRLVANTGDGLSVQEGHYGDQYQLRLSRQPIGNVTVQVLDTADPKQVTLDPAALTFTPDNWQTDQTITITPVADGAGETGVHGTTIRHRTSSQSDPEYNALEDVDLWVTIYDESYNEADVLAKPTPDQLLWQDNELGMFIHYSINTYRDLEWDTAPRMQNLTLFTPGSLDTGQWVGAAQAMGAKYIVFVAKHVGGFCMWQTSTSEYSIKNTPYKNGKGDVLAELVATCKARHMKLGVYLSPQDQFQGAGVGGITVNAADQERYDAIYRAQLTEVLRDYGPFMEVWFDGNIHTLVADILKQYAAHAMIFQCPGGATTIRWVGNEDGRCPYPAWNAVPRAVAVAGTGTAANSDPQGDAWIPLECDARIRNTWFWRTDNAQTLKSVQDLMSMYYSSVGHGAVLLLNMTPDRTGAIPQADVDRAAQFGQEIQRRFQTPIAQTYGTGSEVLLPLPKPSTLNHAVLMEDITGGERIREYVVEGLVNGSWQALCSGTAIGHKKIDTFGAVQNVSQVRLRSLRSVGVPIVRQLAVYNTDVSTYTPPENPFQTIEQWYPGHPAIEQDEYLWNIDVTAYISDAGQYEIVFEKTSGDQDIEIQALTVVIDSVERPDCVEALSGQHRYRITIPGIGSSTVVRARVHGSAGGGSYGRVNLRRCTT